MTSFAVELTVGAERQAVIRAARSWLGTPFHHAARIKGVGVDCAQLLIACYVGLGIVAPVSPGYYAPDWFRHERGERLRDWVASRCTEVPEPLPGDLVLFRFGRFESHGGILVAPDVVVHSYRGRGVIESACGPRTPLGSRLASTWTPRAWADA